MDISNPHPAAESASRLPDGVSILPRKPENLDFESVPHDWFAHSLGLSIGSDLFSFIIPEHERFFIRTVRKYKSKIDDPEEQELVRAFIQQEAIHYTTHERYNETRKAYGVDVDGNLEIIRKAFEALEKRYSLKVRLGMTAFMEHCTAIASHQALAKDSNMNRMHPTMRALWEWHAIEEIEHKGVAYDLFKEAGGGYWLRVYSALIVVFADARLFRILGDKARKAFADQGLVDREDITPEQKAERKLAVKRERQAIRRMFLAGLRYFVPGFHPWKLDDSYMLRRVYDDYAPNVQALPRNATAAS